MEWNPLKWFKKGPQTDAWTQADMAIASKGLVYCLEDEPLASTGIKARLNHAGYQVEVCPTVAALLQKVGQNARYYSQKKEVKGLPDLFVLDMAIKSERPEDTGLGIEAAIKLRTPEGKYQPQVQDALQRIPIVLHTGVTSGRVLSPEQAAAFRQYVESGEYSNKGKRQQFIDQFRRNPELALSIGAAEAVVEKAQNGRVLLADTLPNHLQHQEKIMSGHNRLVETVQLLDGQNIRYNPQNQAKLMNLYRLLHS